MPKSTLSDHEILQAALIGLQHSLSQVDDQIAELRGRIGVRRGAKHQATPAAAAPAPKRALSAAARKRIAAAQKKRWAAFRKSRAQ